MKYIFFSFFLLKLFVVSSQQTKYLIDAKLNSNNNEISINTLTQKIVDHLLTNASELRLGVSKDQTGATLIDAGILGFISSTYRLCCDHIISKLNTPRL